MSNVIKLPVKRRLKIDLKKNNLICGDCLEWLKFIPSNSIDVCYIDPPFFSKKKIREIIWGNGYERRAYKDRNKGGIKSYIVYMEERVQEIHRVLKPSGSIFLHCDWNASHRLRVMLDDVFDEKNFVNEIIWCYDVGGRSPKRFSRKHDTIFWYSKTKKYFFDAESAKKFGKERKTGKNSKGGRLGVDENGRPYQDKIAKNGKIYRYYLDEPKIPEDWWTDINSLQSGVSEREYYPTQKPEALLKRIIECSTNKDGIILDCFGGGGTTASSAHQLNRSFITGDVSPVAIKIACKRLNALKNPPEFERLNFPKTKEEWLEMGGHEFAEKICEFMGWECNPKKSNDGGIDGWANNKKIPIQIKNYKGKVGRPEIQKFVGALNGYDVGIFVAWDFAPSVYDYLIDVKKDLGKEIILRKVGEHILDGILIDMDKKIEIEDLYQKVGNK